MAVIWGEDWRRITKSKVCNQNAVSWKSCTQSCYSLSPHPAPSFSTYRTYDLAENVVLGIMRKHTFIWWRQNKDWQIGKDMQTALLMIAHLSMRLLQSLWKKPSAVTRRHCAYQGAPQKLSPTSGEFTKISKDIQVMPSHSRPVRTVAFFIGLEPSAPGSIWWGDYDMLGPRGPEGATTTLSGKAPVQLTSCVTTTCYSEARCVEQGWWEPAHDKVFGCS